MTYETSEKCCSLVYSTLLRFIYIIVDSNEIFLGKRSGSKTNVSELSHLSMLKANHNVFHYTVYNDKKSHHFQFIIVPAEKALEMFIVLSSYFDM